MPRFSLRTLIVVMLVGGPVCAWGWREWSARHTRDEKKMIRLTLTPNFEFYQPPATETGP